MYTPYIMDTAIFCVIALFAARLQIIVNPPHQQNVRIQGYNVRIHLQAWKAEKTHVFKRFRALAASWKPGGQPVL